MSELPWTFSSILLRETKFEGHFVNIEPLRIGAGKEPSLGAPVDLAVLRVCYEGVELPYIPGSSLKGVFRSWATVIAKSRGFRVCSGLGREVCGNIINVKVNGKKVKLNDYIERLLKEDRSNDAMQLFFKHACLICKIFGAPLYVGKVRFSDAYPIDQHGKLLPFSTGIRTGIAIDRRTGAVFRRALYTVEYVELGAKFKFAIRCINLPNYALGLLALILKMIHERQVKLGGFKTRGFGTVKVEDLKFSNRDFATKLPPIMRSLEPNIDEEVDLSGVAELKDGWIISEGDQAWSALKKLEEVWNRVSSKSWSY